MVSNIEQGRVIPIDKERESKAIRFARTDVNNIKQMREILEITIDPANMEHLAGVDKRTGISDIIEHYKKDPRERDGRVVYDNGHVVGIFEVGPLDFARLGIPPEERGKKWEITSAILNRVAIRSDAQKKGIGTSMIAEAERVAFEEHGNSSLTSAIILNDEQKRLYDQAFRDGKLNVFVEWYSNNDARGKIYLRNRKWQYSGIMRDQGSWEGSDPNHVLLIQKTKAAWILEQEEIQQKQSLKG